MDEPIALYVAHLRSINRRPDSISKRASTLRFLARFTSPTHLLDVDHDLLRTFADRPTLGPEARNGVITHVRGFYRWAAGEGFIAVDPSARLTRPKRPRRLPRPMLDDWASIALQTAPDPMRQWFWLAAYAGLRACEMAQLSGHDFILSGERPLLIIQEAKGGQTESVAVAAPLLEIASELAQYRGWCFPKGVGDPSGRQWSGHITPNQVQRRANRFLHDAGIPQTLHQLRHWFGTEVHRITGDLRITQTAMRHRSTSSTAIYTYIDTGDVARALDALPRLTA